MVLKYFPIAGDFAEYNIEMEITIFSDNLWDDWISIKLFVSRLINLLLILAKVHYSPRNYRSEITVHDYGQLI